MGRTDGTKTTGHVRAHPTPARGRASSPWMVTPTQAVLGHRVTLRLPWLFRGVALVIGYVAGVIMGTRIGRRPRSQRR